MEAEAEVTFSDAFVRAALAAVRARNLPPGSAVHQRGAVPGDRSPRPAVRVQPNGGDDDQDRDAERHAPVPLFHLHGPNRHTILLSPGFTFFSLLLVSPKYNLLLLSGNPPGGRVSRSSRADGVHSKHPHSRRVPQRRLTSAIQTGILAHQSHQVVSLTV